MKNNNSKSTAFSLIELSIVILIIGILIVGVTQGSIVISKMRLTTAAAITQSSPVSSIPNLTSWYETTSEKSFDYAESKNGSVVTNWYDINPQSSTKFNATASGTARPVYTTDSINNLPTLNFDGTNDAMTIGSVIEAFPVGFTVFIVESRNSATSSAMFGTSNGQGATDMGYSVSDGHVIMMANSSAAGSHWLLYGNYAYTAKSPRIWAFSNNVYLNGANLGGANGTRGGAGTYTIGRGGNGFYSGSIAEVIIYARYLKNEERRSVEAYLAKKWKLIVT